MVTYPYPSHPSNDYSYWVINSLWGDAWAFWHACFRATDTLVSCLNVVWLAIPDLDELSPFAVQLIPKPYHGLNGFGRI